jgi:hypothetical protein
VVTGTPRYSAASDIRKKSFSFRTATLPGEAILEAADPTNPTSVRYTEQDVNGDEAVARALNEAAIVYPFAACSAS